MDVWLAILLGSVFIVGVCTFFLARMISGGQEDLTFWIKVAGAVTAVASVITMVILVSIFGGLDIIQFFL